MGILEVSADDGSLLVDGSSQAFANDAAEDSGVDVLSFAAGYTLKRSTKGKHGRITVYDINLGDEKKISIRCNTKSMMLFVDVTGYFEDSEGLLGIPTVKSGKCWILNPTCFKRSVFHNIPRDVFTSPHHSRKTRGCSAAVFSWILLMKMHWR